MNGRERTAYILMGEECLRRGLLEDAHEVFATVGHAVSAGEYYKFSVECLKLGISQE